jgi:hypothetical protein
MGASSAARLPASHRLLSEMDFRVVVGTEGTRALELSPGQNEEPTQIVLVEIFDRIEQIAVEGHQATESGANSRVTVRRSVNVHPRGGIMRSA